jgi:hypothetical protein
LAGDIEAELEAIKTLQQTLEPLAPEVRTRVLDYVFRILEITAPVSANTQAASLLAAQPSIVQPVAQDANPYLAQPQAHKDILSLKLEKQPTTTNQMIALVAYYLAHEAPLNERKTAITMEDVKKYFVQGRYPLPTSQGMALTHARNAGYLDPVDRGSYRLNSVGFNLVVHKMGNQTGETPSMPNRSPRKAKKKGK